MSFALDREANGTILSPVELRLATFKEAFALGRTKWGSSKELELASANWLPTAIARESFYIFTSPMVSGLCRDLGLMQKALLLEEDCHSLASTERLWGTWCQTIVKDLLLHQEYNRGRTAILLRTIHLPNIY